VNRPVASLTTRRLAAASALLLLAGCAGVSALGAANRRMPAVVTATTLTPARPGSASFGPDATRACPVGGAHAELDANVAARAKEADLPLAVSDGRLCAVAEALLSWPDQDPPGEEITTFLTQHFGLPTGIVPPVISTLETEDSRNIATRIAEAIGSFSARVNAPAYGMATERIAKNRTRVVLVLQNAPFTLAPLPRRLEPGQRATVSGTLGADLENPGVLVSDAQGRLTTATQPPGKDFKAELSCDTPGRIIVEVRAEDMGNERVIATLPVACGRELPGSVPLAQGASWPSDPGAQEQKVAELINAERTGAGLPALTWSEPVGKIARAVAEATRDARTGAAQVNVVQRLGEADIQAPVVLQNPAAAWSGQVAHERLLASPTHRANIMSTEVTEGGIGVAVGTDQAGKPQVTLVQLFIKVQQPPDVAAAKRTIRESIDAKRQGEKLAPLTPDPVLERLASEYAEVVASAGGPPPKARTEALVKELRKGYRDTVFMVDARIDLADFAEDPNALAPGKLVGLGGALGRHPRLGKNTLFVVMIIANPLKAGAPAKAKAKK
jgi:uncharacterized protein YkwD